MLTTTSSAIQELTSSIYPKNQVSYNTLKKDLRLIDPTLLASFFFLDQIRPKQSTL